MISQWEAEAKRLGYPDEKSMWEALYPKSSLSQLAKQFNKGINTVRDRIAKCGVTVGTRGGPNNTKVDIDPNLLEDVIKLGVSAAAKKSGVRPQVLYNRLYYKYGLTLTEIRAKQAALNILPQPSQGEGTPNSKEGEEGKQDQDDDNRSDEV